jgi:hypothetical protein
LGDLGGAGLDIGSRIGLRWLRTPLKIACQDRAEKSENRQYPTPGFATVLPAASGLVRSFSCRIHIPTLLPLISGFLFRGIFPNISNLGGLGNKGLKLMRCKEHTNLAWFLLDQDEKTLRYLSKVGFSPISLKNKLCHNKLAQLPLRSK